MNPSYLHVKGYFLSSAQVGQKGQGEDIEEPSDEAEEGGKDDEQKIPFAEPPSKEPHAHIQKHKILGHDSQGLEDMITGDLGLPGEVVGVIVGEDHPTEEQGHHT